MINYLRILNKVLSVIIILIGLYLVFLPYIPEIVFAVEKTSQNNEGFVYETKLVEPSIQEKLKPIPQDNRLVIPQIGVDGEIYEGGKEALDKGIWRRPSTGNPQIGGNTVIVAHRFLYNSGPITFYHLDKMKVGDKFSIYWEREEYTYEVFEIFEVEPNAVEIEDDTVNNIVTLYTCTPLYTASKRLVVRAELL